MAFVTRSLCQTVNIFGRMPTYEFTYSNVHAHRYIIYCDQSGDLLQPGCLSQHVHGLECPPQPNFPQVTYVRNDSTSRVRSVSFYLFLDHARGCIVAIVLMWRPSSQAYFALWVFANTHWSRRWRCGLVFTTMLHLWCVCVCVWTS